LAPDSRGQAGQDLVGLTHDAVDQLGNRRQVVDEATTWPLAITPRSGRPSTMAAFRSIGVLAAISTWLHVSSWLLRMAAPSRTRSRHAAPDSFRKRSALRTARGSNVTGPLASSRSTSSVRSTRWGTPSTRVVTTVSVTDFDR